MRNSPRPRTGIPPTPRTSASYGLSWNAQLGTSGIAFQGEVSYRQDNPLQVDDVELLFAALSPLSSRYADASQITNGTALGFEETALGYRPLDTSQLQFTLTKIFSRFLGADQGVILGEFGFHKVFDMPSKDELRFEGPGTYTSGNPEMTLPGGLHPGQQWEDPEHFADDFSWGYRIVSRLTYNNAIAAWALSPRISWQHDVERCDSRDRAARSSPAARRSASASRPAIRTPGRSISATQCTKVQTGIT